MPPFVAFCVGLVSWPGREKGAGLRLGKNGQTASAAC